MNLKDKRAAEVLAAQTIVDAAKAAGAALTVEQGESLDAHFKAIEKLDADIARDEKSAALFERVASIAPGSTGEKAEDRGEKSAATLGDHFVKSVGEKGFSQLRVKGGHSVAAPEFKAATDTHATSAAFAPWTTDVDRTVVTGNRQRLTVADLLGVGTVSGNAITYFVESAFEGNFETVAEGGQKPQIHVADPTPVTDAIKKIAAWFDNTDEMIEDLPFWVSEINNRGLYQLALVEEAQLLNGAGTGSTVKGLLKRDGIQTETAADNTDNEDAIFRAITKVQTATGLDADGIMINPADYQKIRLAKDLNGQYVGGGVFAGQYGTAGQAIQPPLWGLKTVVTAAVPAGTAVVGSFKQAGTVYRKGGVRVESTNSDGNKFTTNVVTTRIEERVGLAVRVPAAIVTVALSSVAPVTP